VLNVSGLNPPLVLIHVTIVGSRHENAPPGWGSKPGRYGFAIRRGMPMLVV